MNMDTELGYQIYVRINETNDSRLKQLLSEFNILQNLDLSLDHSMISFLVISHGLHISVDLKHDPYNRFLGISTILARKF